MDERIKRIYPQLPKEELDKQWSELKEEYEKESGVDFGEVHHPRKLPQHGLNQQRELLERFSDYVQKRQWEDGDKDLSEFIDDFLNIE